MDGRFVRYAYYFEEGLRKKTATLCLLIFLVGDVYGNYKFTSIIRILVICERQLAELTLWSPIILSIFV